MSARPASRDWVGVFAPATVANVGPGFDCFGFAVEQPGDVVRVRIVAGSGAKVLRIEGDGGKLPREPDRNTASVAALRVLEGYPELAAQYGLELEIDKGLPLCSGLGSSAASAAAGAVAAMEAIVALSGATFDRELVLRGALAGEAVASGAEHADNVAPALLGGFTIVQSRSPLRVERFDPALELAVALVTPQIEIPTKTAREILPRLVPLDAAVDNWSNSAALVLALLRGDCDLLAAALCDRIVEPHRAALIPGCEQVKAAALEAGALGASISGAGPTIFALALDQSTAQRAAEAMHAAFQRAGLQSQALVTRPSPQGARRI
ncbi:MAG: homoserine kinase [Candidatus Alcyoniella australis]|nr:homoserine kinase [Candidatus Alcyoniella australis]